MTQAAQRAIDTLSPADQATLEGAHRDLREAVAEYERAAIPARLGNGDTIPLNLELVRPAQEAVQNAERRLWELRSTLLGWTRPGSTPSAMEVADWFDEEVDYGP